jgi:hypothetical protein
MNIDEYGKKFNSPAARKNLLQTGIILFKDSFPPPGGYN